MNELYTQIAGFNIKFVFKKSSFAPLRNRIKSEFSLLISGFVLDKPSANVDLTIEFIDIYKVKDHQSVRGDLHFGAIYEVKSPKRIQAFYQISRYQFISMLQNVLYNLLLTSNGYLLHSSASNFNNKAFIFVGRSGAGKSTIAKLISKQYPTLSDDMSLIRVNKNGKALYYQNPFIEKNAVMDKSPSSYAIDKIFFLVKDNKFKIEKIGKNSAIEKMAKQIVNPNQKAIKNLMRLTSNFNGFYLLRFDKDETSALSFFRGLNGKS
ncbi:MAG TPA: hypothetical protein VIK81_02885 [Patescibacteria group bacterium]